MTIRIFTYGTLMKGMGLHEKYMNDAKYIKDCTLLNTKMYVYLRHVFEYPMVISGPGAVKGELWDVSDRVAEKIDYMERCSGYKSHYIKNIKAHIWLYVHKIPNDSSDYVYVGDGDFRRWIEENGDKRP